LEVTPKQALNVIQIIEAAMESGHSRQCIEI